MDPTALPDGMSLFDLISLPGLPLAALVLVGTWAVARSLERVLAELGDRYRDRRLLLVQLSTLLSFVVWLAGIAASSALALRFTESVVLALTGTIAVTVGFAFKDLAASVLAGVIILIDQPFRVGDRVTFSGVYGEVTAIGLRSVRLVTLDDNVITIPNSKFLTDLVSSGNLGALDMLVQVDFFVSIEEDPEAVRALVSDCLTTVRYVTLRKPWTVLVNQVVEQGHLAWRLRTKAYVYDVQFEKAYETDLTLRVARSFREHQVRYPTFRHTATVAT